MRPCARWAGAAACIACLVSLTKPARAGDYRRPGLEGQWSRRHLTAPMNSLRVIVGPGQPMLLGDRFDEQIVDGGAQYIHGAPSDVGPGGSQLWLRGGVGFGLTEDWEAGALFVPLKLAPDLAFSNITVFITRGFRFESWDLGVRLSFQTPSKDSGGGRVWNLNPGVPFLYRSNLVRLDGALLVPFATRDWWVGLNLPLRATFSVTPHFFCGIESAFVQSRFDQEHATVVPLGALVGYTELFGSKVVDLTATFTWDSFLRPNPGADAHAIEAREYRVGLGLVYHSLVR